MNRHLRHYLFSVSFLPVNNADRDKQESLLFAKIQDSVLNSLTQLHTFSCKKFSFTNLTKPFSQFYCNNIYIYFTT